MELEFSVPNKGEYSFVANFTMAADYAIIQVELDGKALGSPLDLYNYPDVLTSGEITFGNSKFEAGPHKLTIVVSGTNPAAVPANMVGLDYLRLQANSANLETKDAP